MTAPDERPAPAWRTLLLIGTLYVSQGIPMGLGFIALPAILRTLGWSAQEIGFLGIILVPWAVKFLWAPLVDRRGGGWLGPRRSWIAPAQLALVAIYLLLAVLPASPQSLWTVLGLLLAANFVSATQDIATDGLAVEMLRATELGWANGLQIGGFSFGMIVGGALTVVAYEHGGWQTSFVVLAAAMALTLVPVLTTTEARGSAAPRQDSTLRSLPSLANMLRRPGARAMLFIAGTFYFCTTMVSSMKGPFLVDAGLSLTEAGIVGGTSAATISIAGAGLGSFLVHRLGAARTAIWGGAVSALLLGLWLIPAVSKSVDLQTAIAITLAIGLMSGAAYVAFFTIFMAWASPDQAGTDFTVLQCAESWTNIAASVVAGQIAGTMGFAALFAIAPIVGLVLIALIAILLFRLDRGAGKVTQAGTAEAPC